MARQQRVYETPPEPPKKKGTDNVVPFRRGAIEAKETVAEKKQGVFEAYRALDGCLTATEYNIAMEIAGKGLAASEIYIMNAKGYAERAGIKLLSGEVLRLYAVLRDHFNNPDVPDKLAVMSDQNLLAEVLRMKGEDAVLQQLTTAPAFAHIFKKKD